MRDITRTQLCTEEVRAFSECSRREGLFMAINCREEKDWMVACQQRWMEKPEFVAAVTEEYLNERSHYRQTGIKQKRYERGKFIARDPSDPSLDRCGFFTVYYYSPCIALQRRQLPAAEAEGLGRELS